MIIIRARIKPLGGPTEFFSIKGRIKSMLKNNPDETYNFVMDDNGRKAVKTFGMELIDPELVGKQIPIIDNTLFAKFNEDGTVEVIEGVQESLPRESTVRQLKMLRKLTKKTDIGDRIPNLGKQGANIAWDHNPIDTGIESYEDMEKKNQNFIPSWNLKHLISPFKKGGKSKK